MNNTKNTPPLNHETVTAEAIKVIGSLFNKLGHLPTIFTCMGEHGISNLAPNSQSQIELAENMRLVCTTVSAYACVLFSEAWDFEVRLDESTGLAAQPLQVLAQNKIVTLIVETRGQKCSCFQLPITTDSNGKRVLGKPAKIPAGQILGQFTNVLPARPASEAERVIARCVLERRGLFQENTSFN